MVRELARQYLEQIGTLDAHIAKVAEKTGVTSGFSKIFKRLQTAQGVGPVMALAIEALAP